MLEDLNSVAWESKAQPEWNGPDAVPRAIRKLVAASSDEEMNRSYHEFLYSVGNNHAGTYYPVVLDTVPFLAQMLHSNGAWTRNVVLDILVDLAGSFEPERGYETVECADGRRLSARDLLRQALLNLVPELKALARSTSEQSRTRELAREVLELLTP